MQDVGGVNVLEAAENLVDERLEVGIGQWLARANDGCQVALHEFCPDISTCTLPQLAPVTSSPSYRYVSLKFSGLGMSMSYRHVIYTARSALSALQERLITWTYIAMASEVLQQLDLSQGPFGQNLLAEHIGDLLDSDTLARLSVGGRTVY